MEHWTGIGWNHRPAYVESATQGDQVLNDNIESLRGEYRRFTSAEVGGVIRMFRESQGIKRAVLATEANVSEKTIERAEGGEGISEDSCRRIARALGMKENAFTDELYIPSPEEAVRIQKQSAEDFQRTHRAVSGTPINAPRDAPTRLRHSETSTRGLR